MKNKINYEDSLHNWCQNNGEFGQRILSEYTGIHKDKHKYFDMSDVYYKSSVKFLWKCSNGHKWYKSIISRTIYKTECPYCSGKIPLREDNLYTWCINNGEFGRLLLSEWTGTTVSGTKHDIKTVFNTSKVAFFWKCKNNHIFRYSVIDRTQYNKTCYKCKAIEALRKHNKATSAKNDTNNNELSQEIKHEVTQSELDNKIQTVEVITGTNDLYSYLMKTNKLFRKKIFNEWTGICNDGNHYEMTKVHYKSIKNMIWKCNKGHEYNDSIYNKVHLKTKCKKCIYAKNNLLLWCQSNGDFGQQLIDEWTGTEYETSNHYEMTEVTRASGIDMIWKCRNGHEWHSKIINRTKLKIQCPKCSKEETQKVKKIKSKNLLTWCQSNGDFGQQLINEWTGTCDDGNHYEMIEVTKSSKNKMLWKCSKGHKWYQTIQWRTTGRTLCHYCSLKGKSLETWCLNNGDYGKQLIDEWTGICDNGNQYNMTEVTKSSNRRMLWMCNYGHKWYSHIGTRTSNYTKCPYCGGNTKGTSYPEQFIYRAIKQIYEQTLNREKYKDLEYDIIIPEKNTFIEYSPTYWHLDKLDRDQLKKDTCEINDINFIQIYACDTDDYDEIKSENLIVYKINKDEHNKQLIEIIEYIVQILGGDITNINFEVARKEAFNFMHIID